MLYAELPAKKTVTTVPCLVIATTLYPHTLLKLLLFFSFYFHVHKQPNSQCVGFFTFFVLSLHDDVPCSNSFCGLFSSLNLCLLEPTYLYVCTCVTGTTFVSFPYIYSYLLRSPQCICTPLITCTHLTHSRKCFSILM